jgi:hypothetical protein
VWSGEDCLQVKPFKSVDMIHGYFMMGLIVGLYTVAAELTKKVFYRRVRF